MTRLAIRGNANTTMEVTPTENGVTLFINGVTIIVVNALEDKPLQIAVDGPPKSLKHIGAGKSFDTKDAREVPLGRTKNHGLLKVQTELLVIDALLELGPAKCGKLMDHLGISTKDPRRRLLTQRLDRMRKRGVIAKFREDRHKKTDFRLVVPNPRIYREDQ